MLPDQQDRLVVVLVRARNPQNIGAVARAMHDLGYTRLRLVNEFPVPFAAAKSAVDASSVLASATEHTTLAPAIADCTLVLGTTAVGERVLEHPLFPLPQAAPRIREALASGGRVALLFGSEKTGLSNEELSFCNALLTIPMNTRKPGKHLSMNLGQAAAVCLYALAEPAPDVIVPSLIAEQLEADSPATAGDLDRLTGMLGEVMAGSGYTARHPANARPASVRRLARRMALAEGDAAVWTGILRAVLRKLTPV